jgi:aquaporin Z
MEAAELASFMVIASLIVSVFEFPSSPLRQAMPNPTLRRALIGIATGSTAIAIAHSPLGRRSGAHFNPSITLAFWRLGKMRSVDAAWYIALQFLGAVAGMLLATLVLRPVVGSPSVNYIVTVPGRTGIAAAFGAELVISFGLMTVVLHVMSRPRLAHLTPIFAGAMVATYILVVAPISGMSMNPARTTGSALAARLWTAIWVYFTAPPLGMLLAVELFDRWRGKDTVRCAKLYHDKRSRCIFNCDHPVTHG